MLNHQISPQDPFYTFLLERLPSLATVLGQSYIWLKNEWIPVEVGKGWHPLLKKLFQELDAFAQKDPTFTFSIARITQDMARLRIHGEVGGDPKMRDEIFDFTSHYEHKAQEICENCSRKGHLTSLMPFPKWKALKIVCETCHTNEGRFYFRAFSD